MLTRRLLLDAAACTAIAREVLAQRARWVRRADTEFYTLGAASYLDAGARYATLAAECNPLLRDRFALLYDHLAAQLAALLEEPVVYAPDKALPGFHVWGVPGIPTGLEASLHFDLQYERLTWPAAARIDTARALSFTLPVRLPRLGGGLTVWNATHSRVGAFYARTQFPGAIADLLPLFEERHEPYACGELVVHSGHILHRIAPVAEVYPDDLRITLQGHGLFVDDRWQLYW